MPLDILPGILALVGIFYYLCGIIGRVTSDNTYNRFRFLVFYQAVRPSKNFMVSPSTWGKIVFGHYLCEVAVYREE